MRPTARTTLLALALTGTALAAPAAADPAATGLSAIGLTSDGKLVRLDTGEGGKTRGGPRVTGLVGDDTSLVGIDVRPQDGQLYGVADGGGVYVLAADGVATLVSELSVPLSGSSFGVDFNPAADRLRIISDTGQNLRHNVNPGGTTIVDGNLGYTVDGVTTPATGVTGAGYTNNDADGAPAPAGQAPNGRTGTTLYDVDTDRDQLVVQNPPNSGTLVAVGSGLGVDAGSVAGFDVYSPLGPDGKAVAGADRAFAVLEVGGVTGLYSVGLGTGAATLLGALDKDVTDIAVGYDQG